MLTMWSSLENKNCSEILGPIFVSAGPYYAPRSDSHELAFAICPGADAPRVDRIAGETVHAFVERVRRLHFKTATSINNMSDAQKQALIDELGRTEAEIKARLTVV